MKKKSSSNSTAAKTNAHARSETRHLCGAATVKSGALDGIALRMIMSDIPKQRSIQGNNLKTVAGKPADATSEND